MELNIDSFYPAYKKRYFNNCFVNNLLPIICKVLLSMMRGLLVTRDNWNVEFISLAKSASLKSVAEAGTVKVRRAKAKTEPFLCFHIKT